MSQQMHEATNKAITKSKIIIFSIWLCVSEIVKMIKMTKSKIPEKKTCINMKRACAYVLCSRPCPRITLAKIVRKIKKGSYS